MVWQQLPKLRAAGSSPVIRSNKAVAHIRGGFVLPCEKLLSDPHFRTAHIPLSTVRIRKPRWRTSFATRRPHGVRLISAVRRVPFAARFLPSGSAKVKAAGYFLPLFAVSLKAARLRLSLHAVFALSVHADEYLAYLHSHKREERERENDKILIPLKIREIEERHDTGH